MSIDETRHAPLRGQSEAEGKTTSEIVRETLEQAFLEKPMKSKVGHLAGRLDIEPLPRDDWRETILERNRRA